MNEENKAGRVSDRIYSLVRLNGGQKMGMIFGGWAREQEEQEREEEDRKFKTAHQRYEMQKQKEREEEQRLMDKPIGGFSDW